MPRHANLWFSFEPAIQTAGLDVVSFSLNEGISQPFALTLELVSDEANIDFGKLIDKPALFTVWDGQRPVRYLHGLVSRFNQGQSTRHRTRYHALLEPRLARAELCSNWRIFQHKTVPQILELMLQHHGITAFELHSRQEHLPREFCVQADETDLAFIARLADEEGFVYRFAHSPEQHKLVFCDRLLALGPFSDAPAEPGDAPHVDTVLYAADGGGAATEPCLWQLLYSEQVRSTRQVQRDYSFRYPDHTFQHTSAPGLFKHPARPYERYDYPGRYKRDAVGKAFVATRAMGLQHDTCIAEVTGDDTRLQPGLLFALTDHPRASLNTYWRVVRVTHEGTQSSSLQEDASGAARGTHYQQTAVLVPGRVEWRPAPLPRPRLDGPQVATVVGPPGEEIHCDEWGRVRVSFPWDRESQRNEFSSCWIRVCQGWAGASWGAMAIPRIGQEVVVQFLSADPDQPLITGRTYSAKQLPPYELPLHKTRMTLKSKTHKGVGFNELRFEDEQGKEEVFVHAQRDMNTHVKHDHTSFTGHDRSTHVGNHAHTRIQGERNLSVEGAETIELHSTATLRVKGKRSVTVGADDALEVGGDLTAAVAGHQRVHAGRSLQLQAGDEIILDGGVSLTLQAGGHALRIDASGIYSSVPIGQGALPRPTAPIAGAALPLSAHALQRAAERGALFIQPDCEPDADGHCVIHPDH